MSNKDLNKLVFNAVIKAMLMYDKRAVDLTRIMRMLPNIELSDVKVSIDMLITAKYIAYNTFKENIYYRPTKTAIEKWEV